MTILLTSVSQSLTTSSHIL